MTLAVSEHFALQSPPTVIAGTILVAPFIDVAMLVATYHVAAFIPILSRLVRFPLLFNYLSTFIQDRWSSNDRIAQDIRANEANREKYPLTLIHAEDDYDIPSHHTKVIFWQAVNATVLRGITYNDLEEVKYNSNKDLGAGGSVVEWRTKNGVIREEILMTGLHDAVMSYPVITLAVMRMFEAADPLFN